SNDTPTPQIYTLSLHDALPICRHRLRVGGGEDAHVDEVEVAEALGVLDELERLLEHLGIVDVALRGEAVERALLADEELHVLHRSEEHTSELQSRENLVCRLLL